MNIYSKVMDTIFAPIIEPILDGLEKGVTIDDHKYNCVRLTKKLNQFIENNYTIHQSLFIADHKQDVFCKESDLGSLILQLSSLHFLSDKKTNEVNSTDKSKILTDKIHSILDDASWFGSKDQKISAQTASRAFFFALKNKMLITQDANNLMPQLMVSLPPEKWFSTRKIKYGSSFLLRSLLMMHQSESNDLTSEYIKEVSESLLRRMEIKQENILKFDAPFLDGSYLILEQIRFILATLEIASQFNDLRFLNAAMKANDRLQSFFKRLRISDTTEIKNIQNILLSAHYIESITTQEEQFSKLSCEV